ncbi:MAG: hypothetical protein AAB456_01450, partial [Patescibacteria group bacterium]
LKVLLTATTSIQGQLFVADKTSYGFVVKSFNGPGDGKFDWLVIARRKGYEGADSASATPAPEPSPSPDGSGPTVTPSPSATPTPLASPPEPTADFVSPEADSVQPTAEAGEPTSSPAVSESPAPDAPTTSP